MKSTFTRNFAGKSTFPCGVCHRLTRDVGDNGGVELCPQCFELAGIDNAVSDADDKSEVIARYLDEVLMHLGALKAKGIDVSKVWGDLMRDFDIRVNDKKVYVANDR